MPHSKLCSSTSRLWDASLQVDVSAYSLIIAGDFGAILYQKLIAGDFGAILYQKLLFWCHLTELVYKALSAPIAMLIYKQALGCQSPS
jgi:hypothetical protein